MQSEDGRDALAGSPQVRRHGLQLTCWLWAVSGLGLVQDPGSGRL